MTRSEVQAELDLDPFAPFRMHLASGKTLDVYHSNEGWMLKNSILVTRRRKNGKHSYDVVSLYNIERIERLPDR